MKNPELIVFKPNSMWIVTKNSKGKDIHAIQLRWWHKLMFWRKWVYAIDEWKVKREYKSLKELL